MGILNLSKRTKKMWSLKFNTWIKVLPQINSKITRKVTLLTVRMK
jgi:hypothetical protein